MKILSPVRSRVETEAVIEAGAGEIYCGVMPSAWKRRYSNVASPNRREWEVSNMRHFRELAAAAEVAHASGVQVFLTLNALYTDGQYNELAGFVQEATHAGVDAVIVADLGLLLKLREMGWQGQTHISTGGTTFNDETVAFYRELGAVRVILPRQNRVAEIAEIAAHNPGVEIEAFILNRGCKNIDGFCTFHHGVNEVRIPVWWRIPKRLHWDYYLLAMMKRLPLPVRERISHSSMFGSVGACFLSYAVGITSRGGDAEGVRRLRETFRNNFNLFSGFDTCGACALPALRAAGVHSVKIVGRSNPLSKKIRDVRFLSSCLEYLDRETPDETEYAAFARDAYRKIFGFACDQWCYFPPEDCRLAADTM